MDTTNGDAAFWTIGYANQSPVTVVLNLWPGFAVPGTRGGD